MNNIFDMAPAGYETMPPDKYMFITYLHITALVLFAIFTILALIFFIRSKKQPGLLKVLPVIILIAGVFGISSIYAFKYKHSYAYEYVQSVGYFPLGDYNDMIDVKNKFIWGKMNAINEEFGKEYNETYSKYAGDETTRDAEIAKLRVKYGGEIRKVFYAE